jgi:hypothetical protein
MILNVTNTKERGSQDKVEVVSEYITKPQKIRLGFLSAKLLIVKYHKPQGRKYSFRFRN